MHPNILFVFSDQHRWCDLGCYGNEQVISPHFDAFAQEAAQLTHCVSNSPLCVPARGILLTSLFPLKHGAITNDLPINPKVTSMAQVLQAHGYYTGYIGKWHLAGIPRDQFISAGPRRLGFETWKTINCGHRYIDDHYYDEADNRIDFHGYEPEVETELAIDFVKERAGKDRPWSLHLSWGPPHDPYQAVPRKYLNLYDPGTICLRDNVGESILRSLKTEPLSRADIRKNLQGYYAHITALDEQFGRLLKALRETRQLENTIVVYTSDHGDMLGSQNLCNKQLPYEESIRVPLLVQWKGRTRISVNDELIGLVDLAPSILGLAGISFQNPVDGRDLHALFTEPNARGRDHVYIFDLIPCHQAEDRDGREWRGVRTKQFTFVRSAADAGYLLYDNEADPFQRNNLISHPDYAKVCSRLNDQLMREVETNDALLPWEEFIRRFGFVEAWNKSQFYFERSTLYSQGLDDLHDLKVNEQA